MWISACIKSLIDFLSKFVDYQTTKTENQTTTAVLKEKEKLKQASDLTEEILWYQNEYFATDSQFTLWLARLIYDELTKDEKRLFRRFYKQKTKIKKHIEKLRKKFEKVN